MAVKDAKSQTGKPPRYMQLAGELREAIVAGKFAEGSQFPTENALCKRYEVSRFTVREALRRLQAEGLIARKRGSGTTVQRAAARSGTLHQPLSNVGEILQYGGAVRLPTCQPAAAVCPDIWRSRFTVM
ncbi:GntR family transcriptional regulator [Altererythrobacter aquiaggeris]|uniref:GntR family transcriptional regulator n=1 Tax=Aestuarierythrobacter aquiaggeris TaxID=1898396 RepID=UPI003017B22B